MTKTTSAMNNETRNNAFESVMNAFNEKVNKEIVRTDVTSFDFPITREDGAELWATVKVTLHKEDYDVDEKAAEYQEIVAERERKAAEMAEKKRKAAEKKAEREAKKKSKTE